MKRIEKNDKFCEEVFDVFKGLVEDKERIVIEHGHTRGEGYLVSFEAFSDFSFSYNDTEEARQAFALVRKHYGQDCPYRRIVIERADSGNLVILDTRRKARQREFRPTWPILPPRRKKRPTRKPRGVCRAA